MAENTRQIHGYFSELFDVQWVVKFKRGLHEGSFFAVYKRSVSAAPITAFAVGDCPFGFNSPKSCSVTDFYEQFKGKEASCFPGERIHPYTVRLVRREIMAYNVSLILPFFPSATTGRG